MTDVVINRRFCGPKNSGNGGYSAGVFAQEIDGPAEVTLMAPPPLDQTIAVRKSEGDAHEARHGDALVAIIKPGAVSLEAPQWPDDTAIARAHDDFLSDTNGEHLLPFCFVCGTKRAPDDGLRLFTGPAPESPVNADFWTPSAEFADETGHIQPEFLWAALDCPTAFSLRLWPRLLLLGRLTADIRRRPRAGERLIAAAWPDRSDGRKHFASSVLLDGDREIVAAANALWVEIKDEAMLRQFAAERA